MHGFILGTGKKLPIINNNISHSCSKFTPESEKYRTDRSVAEPSKSALEKNMRWIKNFFLEKNNDRRLCITLE
jgi:hypothetical protein